MLAEFLVLAVLPLLLAIAAGWDLASFTIPNFLSLALVGSFVLFALAAHLGAPLIGAHLLAGFLGLTIGFTFFALGYIGGGDAKIFASVTLWLGFSDLLNYALLASIAGGALTLGILAMRQWPLPSLLASQGWILRLHDEKAGIPYGIALAAGAVVLLPYSEIFRLAVAA